MTQHTRQNLLSSAGLMLTLPAAYFFCINILKHELGINEPYDSSYPLLVSMGVKESLGWNINLLILAGPLVGFILGIAQVIKIKWASSPGQVVLEFTIKKHWFPLVVAGLSTSLIVFLFIYLVGENRLNHTGCLPIHCIPGYWLI